MNREQATPLPRHQALAELNNISGSPAEMVAAESKRDAKRQRTREKLIEATRSLVEERSDEKISIQDITLRADVGLGTFYNHFENKQDIYEAILGEMRQAFENRLSDIRDHQTDPASLLATTLKFCFNEALDNEEWQRFIEQSGVCGEHLLLQSPQQCLEDIALGAKRGRFKIDNPEFVANLIVGLTRHVTLEMTEGKLSRDAITDTTRYVLRMLGLPDLVAKAVTQAPLPPVAAAKRAPVKEILPHLTKASSQP